MTDVLKSALEKRFGAIPDRSGGLPICVTPPRRADGRSTLSAVMGDLGFVVGIEIGTRDGISAEAFCRSMSGLKLTCIDPYTVYGEVAQQRKLDHSYAEAQARLADYDVEILRTTSREAARRFENESVDFVHIDGDHSFNAVVVDLIDYVPKVRKGGLVILHDYFRHAHGGVMEAVDAYTRCHGIDPWYVTFDVAPTAFWQRGVELR